MPRLPPAFDGVGDFAALLSNELALRFGVNSHFVLGDPSAPEPTLPHARIIERREPAALQRLLPRGKSLLVVHYVGYGFATNGCPFWLVKALCRWRATNPEGRLFVIFHELAAFGPLWSSMFWLYPAQWQVIRQLARLADARMVSTEFFRHDLAQMRAAPEAQVQVTPVFSPIGEANVIPHWSERKNQMVIFGTRASRTRLYRADLRLIERAIETWGIDEVIDVGLSLDELYHPFRGLVTSARGPLRAEEVSSLFATSRFAAVQYAAPYLAKSGIFASYAAHGLCTLVTGTSGPRHSTDGLHSGREYLSDIQEIANTSPELTGARALAWYQAHKLSSYADTIFKMLPY